MAVINTRSAIVKYTIFGIAFGLCFPVAAITFDVLIHYNQPLNFDSIKYVHRENPIHYLIDTAPVFLGLAFGIAGYYLQRARLLNLTLSRQANYLANANVKLTKAVNDFQEAQSRLLNSEKLASLGQLTAGIAHELRNPLNFINNFSEAGSEMIEDLNESEDASDKNEIIRELKNNFQKINEHGKRANNILEGIMLVARTGKGEKKITDINVLCKDAGNIAFHGISSSVIGFKCDYRVELFPGIPKISIVHEDFSRVIINLLTNSFYAVNKRREKEGPGYKPVVTLSTSLETVEKYKGSDFISIRVRDNGTGIPASVIDQIFNPFFTTKPSGEGTGLGLSISHDIILAHGGNMNVVSEENHFTEFTITLPLAV